LRTFFYETLPKAITKFKMEWTASWAAVRDEMNRIWLTGIKPILESIARFIDNILKAFDKVKTAAATAQAALTGGEPGKGGTSGNTVPKHNAAGTKSFTGGFTTLDEQGTELVFLPRGTEIVNHNQSRALMAGLSGGGSTTIHFSPTINTPVDLEEMYYRLGEMRRERD
jgi:phage-related tail protein